MKAKQPICFHIHAEQVIPDKPESFGLKIPGGLSISLERDSEGAFIYPEGVNFVHANGFLAACETYEEALKLCERTLDKHFELSGERISENLEIE